MKTVKKTLTMPLVGDTSAFGFWYTVAAGTLVKGIDESVVGWFQLIRKGWDIVMAIERTDSTRKRLQGKSSAAGARAGMAKDQLIFLIVCGVAVVVAVVAVVYHFKGSSKIAATEWQCLDCGREFSLKKYVAPPIECPKCGGQAVRLVYRTCPECQDKVLFSRVRRIGGAGAPGGMGGPMGMPPMEAQFWAKQSDGNYGWTDWMSLATPQARQFDVASKCPECGASLYTPPAQPPSYQPTRRR